MTPPLTGPARRTPGSVHPDPHLSADVVDLLAVLSLNGDAPADDDSPDAASGHVRHLAGCAVCREALAARVATAELDRESVDALVDAALSEPALEAQRRSIFARLAARRDNGRVLEFPARAGRPARRDRPGVRWLAAAAAAGLFVGMLAGPRLGPMLDSPFFGGGNEGADRLVAHAPAAVGGARLVPHDELFLSELETVVNNRGALPLRALDDLTPEPVAASVRSPR